MAAINACRTALLGGHQEACNQCGTIRNSYNSCRNRHCPKCQTMAKEEWLDKRKQELLPCLFKAVRNTIIAFAADPQWKLEGKPGLLTILYSWSQTLINHFHIHCLIPAGVLSFDGRTWKPSNDKYLFRVQFLAREFKKQYLAMITASLDPDLSPKNSATLLQQAAKKDWIVYAKRPFTGTEQILEYLGRYTHRIAISNHRLKSIGNDKITFTYRDRQHDDKLK